MKYPFFIVSSLLLPAYILCSEYPIRDKTYFDEKAGRTSAYNSPEYNYYSERYSSAPHSPAPKKAPTNDIEIILPASTLQIDMSQSNHQAKVYLKPKDIEVTDRAPQRENEAYFSDNLGYRGAAYEEPRGRRTNDDQLTGLSFEEREIVRQHRFEKQLLQDRRNSEERWRREQLERESLIGLSSEEREILRQHRIEKERIRLKEEQEGLARNRWSNLSVEEQEALRLYYIRQNESSLPKEGVSLGETSNTPKTFISKSAMNEDNRISRKQILPMNEEQSSLWEDQAELSSSQSKQPIHKDDHIPDTTSSSMSDELPASAYKLRFVADEQGKMDQSHAIADQLNDSITSLENTLISSNETIDSNIASSGSDFFQSNAFYINKGVGEDYWNERDDDYSYEVMDDYQNNGQFYLSHTFGRGLGSQKGYTTLGAFFIPSMLSTRHTLSFIDGKGHYFDDGKWAGSVGVGSRYLINCRTAVGVNAYYDYRRFHKFDLNQIGVGFELLGNCVDFRLNGYIPIGKKNFSRKHCYNYSGGYLAVFENRAFTWYGVDAEVGKWLKEPSCCNWFSLYAAAGPYYYWRNQHDQHEHHLDYHSEFHREHHHVFGGRARLEAAFNELFKLSVEATYDPVWHTRVQGQIAVVVPLTDCQSLWNTIQGRANSCVACCNSNRILSQPVYRNKQIVVSQKNKWSWNWSAESSCSEGPTSCSNSCYSSPSYSYCADSCGNYAEVSSY